MVNGFAQEKLFAQQPRRFYISAEKAKWRLEISVGYRWQVGLFRNRVRDAARPQPRGGLSLLKGRERQEGQETYSQKQVSLVSQIHHSILCSLFNTGRKRSETSFQNRESRPLKSQTIFRINFHSVLRRLEFWLVLRISGKNDRRRPKLWIIRLKRIPPPTSWLLFWGGGRAVLKPSQKGRSCQPYYSPVYLGYVTIKSIYLTSILINSFFKHKKLNPKRKYPLKPSKNVY